MKSRLITGGAGFIRSHVVALFCTQYPDNKLYMQDALTCAANLERLKDEEKRLNYTFIRNGVCDLELMRRISVRSYPLGGKITRRPSVKDLFSLVLTDVIGRLPLLQATKNNGPELCTENTPGGLQSVYGVTKQEEHDATRGSNSIRTS